MRIASFDIGKKNFCFCIEEFDVAKLGQTADQVCREGKIVLWENHDLTKGVDVKKEDDENDEVGQDPSEKKKGKKGKVKDKKKGEKKKKPPQTLDPRIYCNMTSVLSRHNAEWDTCDVFLIEQQMSFGGGGRGKGVINGMAIRLGQHCFSYFSIRYGIAKTIIEYPSYNKTQLLGAPKKMKKTDRKKWACEMAAHIMSLRDLEDKDDKFAFFLDSKKQDDLADVVCMTQAYKMGLMMQ